jgi:hypothetical protein
VTSGIDTRDQESSTYMTEPNTLLTVKQVVRSPSPIEIRMRDKPEVSSRAGGSLVMRPTDDGWRLTGAGDNVLFESHGRTPRRPRVEITADAGGLNITVKR